MSRADCKKLSGTEMDRGSTENLGPCYERLHQRVAGSFILKEIPRRGEPQREQEVPKLLRWFGKLKGFSSGENDVFTKVKIERLDNPLSVLWVSSS